MAPGKLSGLDAEAITQRRRLQNKLAQRRLRAKRKLIMQQTQAVQAAAMAAALQYGTGSWPSSGLSSYNPYQSGGGHNTWPRSAADWSPGFDAGWWGSGSGLEGPATASPYGSIDVRRYSHNDAVGSGRRQSEPSLHDISGYSTPMSAPPWFAQALTPQEQADAHRAAAAAVPHSAWELHRRASMQSEAAAAVGHGLAPLTAISESQTESNHRQASYNGPFAVARQARHLDLGAIGMVGPMSTQRVAPYYKPPSLHQARESAAAASASTLQRHDPYGTSLYERRQSVAAGASVEPVHYRRPSTTPSTSSSFIEGEREQLRQTFATLLQPFSDAATSTPPPPPPPPPPSSSSSQQSQQQSPSGQAQLDVQMAASSRHSPYDSQVRHQHQHQLKQVAPLPALSLGAPADRSGPSTEPRAAPTTTTASFIPSTFDFVEPALSAERTSLHVATTSSLAQGWYGFDSSSVPPSSSSSLVDPPIHGRGEDGVPSTLLFNPTLRGGDGTENNGGSSTMTSSSSSSSGTSSHTQLRTWSDLVRAEVKTEDSDEPLSLPNAALGTSLLPSRPA